MSIFLFLFFCVCVRQVDALRLRLEEKEAMLNKKSKQIQEMSEEKGTLNGEIHDLKDMLDVKERKVTVLQKKVGCARACTHTTVYAHCCFSHPAYRWHRRTAVCVFLRLGSNPHTHTK